MLTASPRRFVLSVFVCLSTLIVTLRGAAQAPYFTPGNLVVVVEGCGVQGGTCTVTNGTGTGSGNSSAGGYGDNQAAPMTLFQYAPTATVSATYVNALVLPQNASGGNLPFSGEYGSSSEGGIQLSGAGQYLTVMGYGITAATFDANSMSYGAAPSGALAQSGSLTGQSYTPIPRVVALIDANGNVNTSSAIYNVFNTNNPRSIYTLDGLNAYLSGQGSGADATGGVFYTPLGVTNNTPTPITGLDTTSNTIAQDTRMVQIYNGTLYVSVDSREGSGSNRSFVGTLGTPPATSLYASGAGPTQLSSENNASTPAAVTSTGKLTLTASEANNVNSAGLGINLSPSSYFFANAYTMYVADTGSPKQTSAASPLGAGGLQKWVNTKTDGTGTWKLVYTLSTGLNLVANTSAAGATGLYSLAGVVSGSNVYLYTVNYNIGDLDPTYLYGITDTLAATTNPGNSFVKLATAPLDSNFKGVSFAPAYPAGSATITTVPSGLSVTTAGTGCLPGTYVTPVTLVWTPGSTCTLTTTTPQSTGTTPYVFSQWQDGTTSKTDTVIAPTTSATYTATFTNTYQPVGVLEKAVDNSTTSATVKLGDPLLVSGWAADPVDGAPLSNVKVSVDGTVFGTPTLGISRPDVATAYNNPAYTNSGYQLVGSTNGLALGTHAVTVVAVDSTARTTTFGPLTIDVVATPVVTVSSSSIVYGTASTTLSATVAYTGPTAPAVGLSFTVNGSTTGVGVVTCTGTTSPVTCMATYASATLALGANTVAATEAATTSYAPATGTGTLTVTAATDFTFANSGTTTQTVARGSSTSFAFALGLVSASYPSAVTFSQTGLPAGATAVFSPASVAVAGGAQTVTMTVQTATVVAANTEPVSPWMRGSEGLFVACLIPLCFRRKLRSSVVRLLMVALFACASLGMVAGLTGCSGGSLVFAPGTYPVTVTATSGTVKHTATVTLNLQ